MKKIALFSLIVCGFSFNALGGETFCGVECNSDNHGKFLVCPGTKTVYKGCNNNRGKWETYPPSPCAEDMAAPIGYLNIGEPGGGDGSLVWVKKGTAKTGDGYLFDDDKRENTCSACRQGFKWDNDKGKCVNETETVNGSVCRPGDPNCNANPRTPQLAGPCGGDKKQNDACSAGNHATKGRCRLLSATSGGVEQMTCAATECENGYLLWLNKNGNSQGICHSETYAKDFCSTGCNNCKQNEKCVPWVVDTPSNLKINGQTLVPKKNGAYRECHCEVVASDNSCETRFAGNESAIACCKAGKEWDAVNNTCKCGENEEWKKVDGTWKCEKNKVGEPQKEEPKTPKKNCWFEKNIKITCKDGTSFYEQVRISLSEQDLKELNKASCDDLGTNFDDKTLTKIEELDNIIKNVCKDSNEKIAGARRTIEGFFSSTEKNPDKWKNADGSFNTARLASDLTAGVVLGTVGGVVSGHIIKKKQIEKGFEVLHCTVGGQTVADWGDEFSVGLRR